MKSESPPRRNGGHGGLLFRTRRSQMHRNDPVLCELITQARVVGALEASSAETGVDLHCRGQNARGDLIVQHVQEDLRVLLSSVVESLSEDSHLQPPVR